MSCCRCTLDRLGTPIAHNSTDQPCCLLLWQLVENALEAQRVVSLSKGPGSRAALGKSKAKTRNPLAAGGARKRASAAGSGGDREVTLCMKEGDIVRAVRFPPAFGPALPWPSSFSTGLTRWNHLVWVQLATHKPVFGRILNGMAPAAASTQLTADGRPMPKPRSAPALAAAAAPAAAAPISMVP